MNPDYMCVLALLILAFPLSSHAQSLGDIARQLRSERQQSGTSHTKVITNDDIESRESAQGKNAGKHAANDVATDAIQGESGKEGAENAEAANAAGKSSAKAVPDPTKEREAHERETERRSEEINKVYRDRIAAVRTQINIAQQELARLQRDQVESINQYQQSFGTSASIANYDAQQRLFIEQIEAHRTSISSLNSQLEDAQEVARHAGVPHASD